MLKDWRGTEIKIGSKIVYCVKHSCYVSVHEAEVLEIFQKAKYSWDPMIKYDVLKVKRLRGNCTYGREQYETTITNLNTVTVL